MSEETRYCCRCDQETAEWATETDGGTGREVEICQECFTGVYDSFEAYQEEMVRWLGRRHDMTEAEVREFLVDHGNPGKGQAEAILR